MLKTQGKIERELSKSSILARKVSKISEIQMYILPELGALAISVLVKKFLSKALRELRW